MKKEQGCVQSIFRDYIVEIAETHLKDEALKKQIGDILAEENGSIVRHREGAP